MSFEPLETLPAVQEEPVIHVSGLTKSFRTYQSPGKRLAQIVFEPIYSVLGLESPKLYDEFHALKDINISVAAGETVGILGSNGAGKSTLLQLVCQTLNSTSGHCKIRGRVAALLELGSGFNPDFSGRENVFLNAMILGLTQEEVSERYDSIVQFAGIGDFIDKPVKTYSSGMTVRLAFAVIAHVDADILIVDEALSVGDAFFVQKCMRFIRKFMERGTVLFVSHDSGAILNLCDRAIWLENGDIKEQGQPVQIVPRYLAHQHQAFESTSEVDSKKSDTRNNDVSAEWSIDQRNDFINASNLRNDIEVLDCFVESDSFGVGGTSIEEVLLTAPDGSHLTWVVGGEKVILRVKCRVNEEISNPIIGFQLKDRLGQTLFGDNTFLTYIDSPLKFQAGENFVAKFEFRFPRLPTGEYVFNAAVAEGTQDNHVHHHWVHDALKLSVQQSSFVDGLISVPMDSLSIANLSR